MQKLISSFVVAFVLVAGIASASAQVGLLGGRWPSSWEGWYYYLQRDQAHMLQADQIDFVRRSMNMGRNAQLRRVTDDLAWNGANYGLNTPRGFYPMYQCSTRQRWEKGIGRTVLAGVAGYIGGRVSGVGGKEGAIVGAVGGAGYSVYKDAECRPVNNTNIQVIGLPDGDDGMVVVPPPYESGGPMPQTISGRPRNGWDDRLREQRYGNQPQAPAPVELEWQMLRNEFDGVTIYARVQGLDPTQPIVIPPSQTVSVQIPQGAQIWAEALICDEVEGCAKQRWRQDVGRRPLPQGAGWVFYNPEEGR